MKPVRNDPWDLSEEAAIALQGRLARAVEREDRLGAVRTVAGVDVAYDSHSDALVAAVVVLDAQTMQVCARAEAVDSARFPYIPGLFSFRELPSIAKALAALDVTPDLIICDGQGIAHPRRFGLACHLGLMFDVPTIGCGKTRLLGTAEAVELRRGQASALVDQGEVIGAQLVTQDQTKPVYVSTGHRVSIQTACEWVLKCATQYRLPETTRQADQYVKILLANWRDTRRDN